MLGKRHAICRSATSACRARYRDLFNSAAAAEPLRFYIGAGVGQSTQRIDDATLSAAGTESGPFSFSKHDSFAVRAEYERLNESTGNPDLLSVSGTWTIGNRGTRRFLPRTPRLRGTRTEEAVIDLNAVPAVDQIRSQATELCQ